MDWDGRSWADGERSLGAIDSRVAVLWLLTDERQAPTVGSWSRSPALADVAVVLRFAEDWPLLESSSKRQPLASAARAQAQYKPRHPERFTLPQVVLRSFPFY